MNDLTHEKHRPFSGLRRFAREAFRLFAVCLITVVSRIKFNVHVKNRAGRIASPAVFLCNHTCMWDFSFLVTALFPMRVRFVATSIEFEKSRLYAAVLKTMGVIRKKQGAPDSAAVRGMLRAIRAGESVAIYPAGMTSFDGRPAWNAQEGTGKLLKLMDADVYSVVVNGGFISFPRYSHIPLRGRVDVTVNRVFSREELKAVDANEAQTRVCEAIDFNDWEWQTREKIDFRGKDNAAHAVNMLYKCPNCFSEGTMTAGGRRVACEKCGMTARRDAQGFFVEENGRCIPRMDQWFDMEKDALRRELAKPDFCLRARVRLMCYREGDGYYERDRGELWMTRETLDFSGARERLTWPLTEFQYFIMNDRDFLHIYTREGAYRFVFEETRLITKWFLAHKLLTTECVCA